MAQMAKIREGKKKKTWPQEKVSSNTDVNMLIKKASGYLAGLKKKKSLVMDHHAGKCSTVLKTELATKSFFLQVFCLGWRMQHQGHIWRRCVR